MRWLPMVLLLTACGAARPGPDDQVAADSDPVTDSDTLADTEPATLRGTAPTSAVGLPEFVATNRDGGARGPTDLTGHPTVVWFYPAAGTGG